MAQVQSPSPDLVQADVARALAEDIGDGDVTSSLLADEPARGYVVAKEAAVVAGRPWFDACFRALDENVRLHWRVAEGDAVFSPRLAGFVLDAFRAGERVQSDAELDELTPREREVLQLIARGYRYKEIAGRLHLSVKTVESHVSSVLRKLQLSSRHELTRWAAERRLI